MLKRINRAMVCIRMCVICLFYKLSIGGFTVLECQHISSPFISQANIRKKTEVLAVGNGGSGGQMSLPDPQSIFTLTPKNSSTCHLMTFVSIVPSLTEEL